MGAEYDTLLAKKTSPYININGSRNSTVTRGGIGASHRFNENVEGEILVGYAESEKESTTFGRANVRVDVNDKTTLFLEGSHGFYMISPKSSSLGVERTHSGALVEYRPNLSVTVLAQAEYDLFSSSNKRWSALIAPRVAVERNEKWSMDLGVRLWNFGFDKNLNEGYYNPDLFESYMATVYVNYRFNSDNELFVMGGAGIVKDDTMSSYKFGTNIDLVGTVGIYQDWKFQLKAGYMNNQNESVGGFYDAYYTGLSIVRRF
jgi:opacity protein-like surface antigen